VIHPPIEDSFLNSPRSEKKSYYIAAGALVWYKRFDLAIAACEKKGVPLIIAGNGPYLSQLQKMAGPNTKIVVSPSNEEFRQLLAEAKGLLFPGVEDFGLIAIESMALGTPVIAYRAGGALDFVNSKTGMFFDDQSAESIAKTIEAFEKTEYSYDDLHKFAGQFSEESFLAKFKHELEKVT
jgi:glycosyltransferase involved in cell wall biosynthesis